MNLENKSSLEFETCLQKLQKCRYKIRTVSDSLIELDQMSCRTFRIFTHNKIFESLKLANQYLSIIKHHSWNV